MLAKTTLLLGLCLGLLVGPTFSQSKGPSPKSPQQIRSLMREHMVRRPYVAIERSILLSGRELVQVREVLEQHASTTFQRHLAAERKGLPGLGVMIAKQIEADQKRRQALEAGLAEAEPGTEAGYEEGYEEGLEDFDYLPITVIDELFHLLPRSRADDFLAQLGTEKRRQLARLGQKRALAFKEAVPKMRSALAGLKAAGALRKKGGKAAGAPGGGAAGRAGRRAGGGGAGGARGGGARGAGGRSRNVF